MRRCLISVLLAASALLALAGCGSDENARPDIVFVSARDGVYAIYEMNADGGAQGRLTPGDSDPSTPAGLFFQIDPAWSPNGTKIAFSSRRSGNFDVYVMNADGTGTKRLTSARGQETHPTWSSSGRTIAFERDSDIYVMNADGSNARRISDSQVDESEPAWSPDGAWIAYVRRAPGTSVAELWIMRPDGSDRKRVVTHGDRSLNPAWSPGGARLAFVSNARGPLYDIYTVDIDRARVRRLTASGTSAFEPAWSPDGSLIAFSQGGSIKTVDDERMTSELTSPDGNDSYPVWNPRPPRSSD